MVTRRQIDLICRGNCTPYIGNKSIERRKVIIAFVKNSFHNMLDNGERSQGHPLYYGCILYIQQMRYLSILGSMDRHRRWSKAQQNGNYFNVLVTLSNIWNYCQADLEVAILLCSRCIEGVSLTWEQPELQAKILEPQGLKDKKLTLLAS